MNLNKLILAGLLSSLSACGGGSSDDTTNTKDPDPVAETGVFLDGPIANIGYETETIKNGVTDAQGKYNYLPGEHVTFFIGDLKFPAVTATGVVTPLDLVGTTDTANPTVVNMIRLLQTLDKDGIPDIIEITEKAKTEATQVNFSLSVAEFEASTVVTDLISNAGQDTTVTQLINADEAVQNFKNGLDAAVSIDLTKITVSSVITYDKCPLTPGGWKYSFTNTAITFTGSDTWDTNAGCTLAAEETFPVPVADLTGDSDLPFNCAAYPVCVSADLNKTLSGTDGDGRAFNSTYSYDPAKKQLTYVKEVEGDIYTEVISLHTANDATSVLGAWVLSSGIVHDVLVFLDKGRYIVAHSDNTAFDADLGMTIPASAEYGTYTWDTTTGVFTSTMLGQSDGEGGLSNTQGSVTLEVDGKSLIFTDSVDGDIPFKKVASASSIVGAWTLGVSNTDYDVVVFLDDSRYIVAHTNNTGPDAVLGIIVPVSAEYGNYTWDPVSEAFTTTVLGESDGQSGFSDSQGSTTAQVDTKNLIFTDSVDGATTLTRIE